jgi:hypothetical protein
VHEYLHEITVFPNGKHDDQVDSTAQFLDWYKRPFRSQGIYELTRIQAEAQHQAYRPEPERPNWAPGSVEWQAEQESSITTALRDRLTVSEAG